MRLELEIALEDDAKMIFQNEGTGRRMLSGRMLKLTSDGQKLVSDHESFLKATQWSYLKKSATPQLKPKTDVRSSWLITPSVKNTFLFFSANPKGNSLEGNPFIFDTFNFIGNDSAKLCKTKCRLQYGYSYFAELDYDSRFKLRIFNDR